MSSVPPRAPVAPPPACSSSTPLASPLQPQTKSGPQPRRRHKPKRRSRSLKQPLTKDMPRLLAALLQEPKVALLHRVVQLAGPKLSWQLLRETLRLERAGGQSVRAEASGRPELLVVVDAVSHELTPRRRTSGGVFFALLKARVTKEMYRAIYEVEDRKKKEAKKRTRSRQRQRMDQTLAKLGFEDLTLASIDACGNSMVAPVASTSEAMDGNEDGEVAEDMQMMT